MNQRHYLLKGTFLLTAAGILTRFAGFYYKIFLSHTLGAEEIGLFQMTMPVFVLGLSLGGNGIQMAVSRYTAQYAARGQFRGAKRILICGLGLSLAFSSAIAVFLYGGASVIASRFLLEPRCSVLIRMLACSLPFASLHACITGYLIGCRQVTPSAAAQLIEQMVRIVTVLLCFSFFTRTGKTVDASLIAVGQLVGEFASALFCLGVLKFSVSPSSESSAASSALPGHREACCLILSMAIPLSLTHVFMSVLQSIEAALLPTQLQLTGMDRSTAVGIYGTLTGMALPLILFPTAVTGSLSTLLMPAVSEAQARSQHKTIKGTIQAGCDGSLLPGCFFAGLFFLFGPQIGELLFHSSLAGIYIRRLALICPFLYLNATLGSILHGLKETAVVSCTNILSAVIRLTFLILLVPAMGMDGYLLSLLLIQSAISFVYLTALRHTADFSLSPWQGLLKPALICTLSSIPVLLPAQQNLLNLSHPAGLFVGCLLYTACFVLLALYLLTPGQQLRTRLLPLLSDSIRRKMPF
jgi:stage V sporulation protein B